uniref:Barrier to autointegration factor n=1 Tax=Strongyloides papillosus TaxID=174720 RepID=A0A0N5BYG1_STREA
MAPMNKHDRFISEPMTAKNVTTVPGIAKANGKKLQSSGIKTAHQLYLIYLGEKRNDAKFILKLNIQFGIDKKNAEMCARCFSEYYKPHDGFITRVQKTIGRLVDSFRESLRF